MQSPLELTLKPLLYKSMKKLFYTLGLVIIGITSSYAQERVKGKVDRKDQLEVRLDRAKTDRADLDRKHRFNADRVRNVQSRSSLNRLNLSQDQKAKIKKIEAERAKKMSDWRKKDQSFNKKRQEERTAYLRNSREKIHKILTKEQRQQLASSKNEFRKREFKDRKGRRPAPFENKNRISPPSRG